MREPVVVGIPDRLHLRRRNFVIQSPAATIGVAKDPRIGRKHRPIIIGNHDGAADSLEEAHCLSVFLRAPTFWGSQPPSKALLEIREVEPTTKKGSSESKKRQAATSVSHYFMRGN